jgi:hypothetical protein
VFRARIARAFVGLFFNGRAMAGAGAKSSPSGADAVIYGRIEV